MGENVKRVKSRIFPMYKHSRGKRYIQYLIYLPRRITDDSAFPLDLSKPIMIEIEGDRLVIYQEKEIMVKKGLENQKLRISKSEKISSFVSHKQLGDSYIRFTKTSNRILQKPRQSLRQNNFN